jgi:hypothetical protein
MTKQPTLAQIDALLDFAYCHGRCWRSDLHAQWLYGTAVGELQQLRNSFGPTWLSRVSLKKLARDKELS